MHKVLESVLLMATEPQPTETLAAVLHAPVEEVERALESIQAFYEEHDRGIRLRFVAGGWRLATVEDAAEIIEEWLVNDARALSQAALETLAVIAYMQPVSRSRVAGVRGVNVDGVVRTLMVRGLIEQAGEDPHTGAATFVTTNLFLEKMGLANLDELPDLAPLLPDAVALEAELGQLAQGGHDE